MQVPSPWGGNNRSLAALYNSASSGECPFVIDKSTSPCGNSRFGCWTCTVVTQDRAMEGLIDEGGDWMQPLLDYREDMLKVTQDPKVKRKYRHYKHRDGQVYFKSDGSSSPGPYTLEYRKQLLSRLLKAQEDVNNLNPTRTTHLITESELHRIRRIWLQEGDWDDSLPTIYQSVTGKACGGISQHPLAVMSHQAREILHQICSEEGVAVDLVLRLLEIQRRQQGMKRRPTVFKEMEAVLDEVWRSEDEIHSSMLQLGIRSGGGY